MKIKLLSRFHKVHQADGGNPDNIQMFVAKAIIIESDIPLDINRACSVMLRNFKSGVGWTTQWYYGISTNKKVLKNRNHIILKNNRADTIKFIYKNTPMNNGFDII